MKMNKLFAGVAVATVALSAMAMTVGAAPTTEASANAITTAAGVTTTVAAPAATTATNPKTGNAPIALAAIPVAVVAAAVIAKKSK